MFVLGCLVACATPARRGIALSDAQREAAKDDSEKKKVLVPDEDESTEVEDQNEVDEGPGAFELALGLSNALDPVETAETVQPPKPESSQRQNFSMVGTGISYSGTKLESQAGFGLVYGYQSEPQLRVNVGGYYLDGTLGAQGDGFTDFEELSGELAGRFYVTHDHTLVGMYFQVGARVGLFWWEYANPVVVDEGDRLVTIERDGLTTYSGFVGLGVAPLQLSNFQLGAGANLGVRLYQSVTREGFDNDIFPTVGYRQFYVEATAVF
jgi:hypothetical protein